MHDRFAGIAGHIHRFLETHIWGNGIRSKSSVECCGAERKNLRGSNQTLFQEQLLPRGHYFSFSHSALAGFSMGNMGVDVFRVGQGILMRP